jgi:hypothetical protein
MEVCEGSTPSCVMLWVLYTSWYEACGMLYWGGSASGSRQLGLPD